MLTCKNRFEAQLTAVKERLEAAKTGSTRGLTSPGIQQVGGFSFNNAAGRIAKPLRGGGGDVPLVKEEGLGKRSSWFFSGVK